MLKTSKKILSVVLALVLVLSTLTICSFAAFDPSTQKIAFVLVPDKDLTKVQNGDTVTFTLYYDVADFSTNFGLGALWFLYDGSAYSANAKYTNLGDIAKYSKDGNATLLKSDNKNWTKIATQTTQDISGFDSAYMVPITADKEKDWDNDGIGNTGKQGIKLTQESGTRTPAQLQFTFTVLDNTKNMDVMLCDAFGASFSTQYYKTTDGTTQKNLTQDEVNVELASAMANNPSAPAPAGPAVTKAKSQVKMTATSATTVADEFSFRVISKISDSDWDTYFKNTGVDGAKTDYITAVGMVAYKGAAAFDAETAKEVVAGALVADYAAAKTDYISKVSDTADAEFGAIIKANHSKLGNDVTYMGFVQYVDDLGNPQTIFYETAGTAALSTNYNTIVRDYLARYPFAA